MISFTTKMVDDIKSFALMQRLYQVFNERRTYTSSGFVVLKSLACYSSLVTFVLIEIT